MVNISVHRQYNSEIKCKYYTSNGNNLDDYGKDLRHNTKWLSQCYGESVNKRETHLAMNKRQQLEQLSTRSIVNLQ